LVAGCWLLVAGCWLLVAGCWLLVAGCWLLVAGCWLLVAGCLSRMGLWQFGSIEKYVCKYFIFFVLYAVGGDTWRSPPRVPPQGGLCVSCANFLIFLRQNPKKGNLFEFFAPQKT
jgi:hypothetical protein